MTRNQKKLQEIEKELFAPTDDLLFKIAVVKGQKLSSVISKSTDPDRYLFYHKFSGEKRVNKKLLEWERLFKETVHNDLEALAKLI